MRSRCQRPQELQQLVNALVYEMKKPATDKHKERKRPRSDEEKKESLGAAKPPVAKGNIEDESFPRGGSTGLSHLEKRAVEMEARAEYEAELAGGKQPSSKRPSLDGKVNLDHPVVYKSPI